MLRYKSIPQNDVQPFIHRKGVYLTGRNRTSVRELSKRNHSSSYNSQIARLHTSVLIYIVIPPNSNFQLEENVSRVVGQNFRLARG